MRVSTIFNMVATVFFTFGSLCVSAQADTVNRLTAVDYSGTEDRIELSFRTSVPLSPEQLSATVDGTLLVVSLENTASERRWLKFKDIDIKRALITASKTRGTARIRVRFHQAISNVILENIRVRQDGDVVVTSIPRTVAIAEFWQKSAQTVDEPKVEPKPTDEESDVTQVTESDTETGEEIATDAAAAAAVSDDAIVLDSDEGDLANNALGQPMSGTSKAATVMMALFFLGIVAIFMWRKARKGGMSSTSGPMIRPVGTHMLGAKQGLLLVEVAGDMVLLGTSDKGVQMLTKIEGRDGVEPSDMESRVTPHGQSVPASALADQAKPAFAERFGRAMSKIREATGYSKGNVNAYEAVHQQAAEKAMRDDHLSGLVNQVSDRTATANYRTEFNAVEPQQPPSVYDAQPPVVGRDDLLNKLRKLQGA